MKLKISAYDDEEKLLFSSADFNGSDFYDKIPCKISDSLGFTYMSEHLDQFQKRRIILNRMVSEDVRFIVKMTMQDKSEFIGNSYIRDVAHKISGYQYGNLKDISEFLEKNYSLLIKANRLVFEKINVGGK